MWVFDTCYYCCHPIFRWGPAEDRSLLMSFIQSCLSVINSAEALTPSLLWMKKEWYQSLMLTVMLSPFWINVLPLHSFIMWGGNVSGDSNKSGQSSRTWWDWMQYQCKGHRRKKLGLCRACLNTQHSQNQKGKSKASTRCCRPIIISHKSQTSQDQCLWQHDWWVCHRECQEKWSPAPYLPYFPLWVRFGVFTEESHGRCDEHYPVIMKGTPAYCQPLQTDRQAGGGGRLDAERRCPFTRLCALMPFIWRPWWMSIFIYLHYFSVVIALSSAGFIHSRQMSRGNQVKCAFCRCYPQISNCVLKMFA